jgi:hypothetical protein
MQDLNERYAGAETCECGALIEEIDSGNGFTYWAHVKRMRLPYDHAAVPATKEGALIGKIRKIEALADRYASAGMSVRTRNVADTIRTLLAD